MLHEPSRARAEHHDLAEYVHHISFEQLSGKAIHAAKVRTIDTLGALIGGFRGECCRISRTLAARSPVNSGATIVGTHLRTTPPLAAFVNATTARYLEMSDVYQAARSAGGHPS